MLSASAQGTLGFFMTSLDQPIDIVVYQRMMSQPTLFSDLMEILMAVLSGDQTDLRMRRAFIPFMARVCRDVLAMKYNPLNVESVLLFLHFLYENLTVEQQMLDCFIEIMSGVITMAMPACAQGRNYLMERLVTCGDWIHANFCISLIASFGYKIQCPELEYAWAGECIRAVAHIMEQRDEGSLRIQACIFDRFSSKRARSLFNTDIAATMAGWACSAIVFVTQCTITQENAEFFQFYAKTIESFIHHYGYRGEDYPLEGNADEVRCRYLEILIPHIIRLYPLWNECGFPGKTITMYSKYPDLLGAYAEQMFSVAITYGQIRSMATELSIDEFPWDGTWNLSSSGWTMRWASFRIMDRLIEQNPVVVCGWLLQHLRICTSDATMTESLMFALKRVIPCIVKIDSPEVAELKTGIIAMIVSLFQNISACNPLVCITGILVAASAIPLMRQELLQELVQMLGTKFIECMGTLGSEQSLITATAIAEFFADFVNIIPDWSCIPRQFAEAIVSFSMSSLSTAPNRFSRRTGIVMEANELLQKLHEALNDVDCGKEVLPVVLKFHDGLMGCLRNGQDVNMEGVLNAMIRFEESQDTISREDCGIAILEAVCIYYPEEVAIVAMRTFIDHWAAGACYGRDCAMVIVNCLCSRVHYNTPFKDLCMTLLMEALRDNPEPIDALPSISAVCRLWQSGIQTDGYWDENMWVELCDMCQAIELEDEGMAVAVGLVSLELVCTKLICRGLTDELVLTFSQALQHAISNGWLISDYYRWIVCAVFEKMSLSQELQTVRTNLITNEEIANSDLIDEVDEMLVCGIDYPPFERFMEPYKRVWVDSFQDE